MKKKHKQLDEKLEELRSKPDRSAQIISKDPPFTQELEAAAWLVKQNKLLHVDKSVHRRSKSRLMGRIMKDGARVRASRISAAMRPVLVTLLVLVFLFSSTGAVYAAQDSLPGDTLYGLKLGIEEVRLALASSPDAHAELLAAYIETRYQEIEALAQGGDFTHMEQALDRLAEQLASVFALQDQVYDPSSIFAVQLSNAAHQERLAQILAIAPDTAQFGLEQALKAAGGGDPPPAPPEHSQAFSGTPDDFEPDEREVNGTGNSFGPSGSDEGDETIAGNGDKPESTPDPQGQGSGNENNGNPQNGQQGNNGQKGNNGQNEQQDNNGKNGQNGQNGNNDNNSNNDQNGNNGQNDENDQAGNPNQEDSQDK